MIRPNMFKDILKTTILAISAAVILVSTAYLSHADGGGERGGGGDLGHFHFDGATVLVNCLKSPMVFINEFSVTTHGVQGSELISGLKKHRLTDDELLNLACDPSDHWEETPGL